MNPNPVRAILAGVAGTAVLTMMTLKVAPMILGRPMDIRAMMSAMTGGPPVLGWAPCRARRGGLPACLRIRHIPFSAQPSSAARSLVGRRATDGR